MADPIQALIIAGVVLGLAGLFFLPEKGILARRKKLQKNNQRVLIEDALKHLYDCEYKNINCTIHSIAGSIGISGDKAAKILSRLELMGLLVSDDNGLILTKEGRSYALRIIRIHRLLEKYLADQTGIEETLWHREAEEREHHFTSAQADALAARMGNPLFDPHGDPIPTASGELPALKGMSLSSVRIGEIVRIVHIEDEPSAIYAQLVAEGLYPGMHIRLIESSQER
ncbi:MAG: metal-dependent transcriptional regulator, partial [Ignavibacteriaceae bacterium]